METNLTESLISTIQKREVSINNIKIDMIKQWISQGEDLLQLQEQLRCSQNDLTKITGVSKGAVHIYIHVFKDERILEWIQGDHHGGQLANFNQKKLLSLTKLDDIAFEASINAGEIVGTPEDQMIDAEIIESSTNEKIYKKEESINKLMMDVMALRKELPPENKGGRKPVAQIDKKGKTIAKYPSAQGSQRITGIDKSSIGNVCRRGSLSTAGGYHWEFIALL